MSAAEPTSNATTCSPKDTCGSLHPKLAWTIAMFPIMTGAVLCLLLLVADEIDRTGNQRLLMVPIVPASVIPVTVWFRVWGPTVRWRGVRPILATAVVGGLGLTLVGVFALSMTGWIFLPFLLLFSGPVIAVPGVAALTLVCWSPSPDQSPGVVVCPECLYDLHMQHVCRCPECGTEYTLEELLAPEEQPLPIGLYEK